MSKYLNIDHDDVIRVHDYIDRGDNPEDFYNDSADPADDAHDDDQPGWHASQHTPVAVHRH